MKQVIFLCLLSVTLCLSKPADTVPADHVPHPAVVEEAKVGAGNAQTPALSQTPAQSQTPAASAQTPVATIATQANPTQSAPTSAPAQASNVTPTHTESQTQNTIATVDNKTEKKEDPAKTEKKPTEGTSVPTSTVAPKTPELKPAIDTKPEHEVPKTVPTSKTEVPKTTDTTKKTDDTKANVAPKDEDTHIVQARGFDGPSFIGGIILSLGLLAIGFMGFKYYKNQTERNYHTL